MNCAERLVEIFGSQADVARAFQLDRAVVHHWVKTGYVPARWAGEVERVTQGRISAVEVINEASVKNPVRVKSRPGDAPFGILSESDPMSQYAPSKRIHSFHPPQRTLMGPGPTEIHPRVLTTMSQPAIGYLDPVFVEMMEELKSLLRYVYQTKNPLTFPLSGPGSVGMEYCFVNMVAPGDKVIVCQNGVFGGRMLENAIRCGGSPVVVEDKWGDPVDPQKLEDALKKNKDAQGRGVRACRDLYRRAVRCEAAHPDRAQVRRAGDRRRRHLARRYAGESRRVGNRRHLFREPEMPVVHPGPVAGLVLRARGRAREEAQGQDPQLVHGHEPAAGLLERDHAHLSPHRADQLALRPARGAAAHPRGRPGEQLGARTRATTLALKAGLEAMGLRFLVREQNQLPQMNAVMCPEGVNEEEVRKRLLSEFGLEIGAGLGPLKGRIWRFGLMGYSCRPDNVMLCLSALGSVLSDMGMPVHVGDAEAAAHGAYAQMHVKDAQRKKRAA